MKVERKFVPMSIHLESEEDRQFILEVLHRTCMYEDDRMFSMLRRGNRPSETYIKARELMEHLK